ncbi:hypothetical protein QVD17_00376 [Tagetes erecta]|uniref:Uncharacterized protein n=1 Tax=Tagetes erecta TaxID=13708 RepID=A0AAD8P760_TARER|nr:hypothetical protein QVD17_00376 [Tagetes erecta]
MRRGGFGLDKSKLPRYNYNQLGHFASECKAHKANLAHAPALAAHAHHRTNPLDATSSKHTTDVGVDADWSFQVEDVAPVQNALMASCLDSESSSQVSTEPCCTPECIAKVNIFRNQNWEL